MRNSIRVAVLLSAAAISSQAMAGGGLLGGVGGTVQAVVADLPGTLSGVVGALPAALQNAGTTVGNVAGAVPGILTGSPINPTSSTISVPLPGPAFLDATVLQIPGAIGVHATAAGTVVVTVTTGQ